MVAQLPGLHPQRQAAQRDVRVGRCRLRLPVVCTVSMQLVAATVSS